MSGQHPGYDYKQIRVAQLPVETVDPLNPTVEEAATYWEGEGWHTVAVFPSARPGFWDITYYDLLLKRVKVNPYSQLDEHALWNDWRIKYEGSWA